MLSCRLQNIVSKRAQVLLRRVPNSSPLRSLGDTRVARLAASETLRRGCFAHACAFFETQLRLSFFSILSSFLLLLGRGDGNVTYVYHHEPNIVLLYCYHIYRSVILILGSPTAGFSANTVLVRESNISG